MHRLSDTLVIRACCCFALAMSGVCRWFLRGRDVDRACFPSGDPGPSCISGASLFALASDYGALNRC